MRHLLCMVGVVIFLCSSASALATCNPNIVITKPTSIYIDHGDGTISDIQTGLMWQKCSLGLTGSDCTIDSAQTYSWQAALAIANANTGSSYDDWRLPNAKELESLVESACNNTAINEAVFPNTLNGSYWSSSPHASTFGTAWSVTFSHGGVTHASKDSFLYVRLVRDAR